MAAFLRISLLQQKRKEQKFCCAVLIAKFLLFELLLAEYETLHFQFHVHSALALRPNLNIKAVPASHPVHLVCIGCVHHRLGTIVF